MPWGWFFNDKIPEKTYAGADLDGVEILGFQDASAKLQQEMLGHLWPQLGVSALKLKRLSFRATARMASAIIRSAPIHRRITSTYPQRQGFGGCEAVPPKADRSEAKPGVARSGPPQGDPRRPAPQNPTSREIPRCARNDRHPPTQLRKIQINGSVSDPGRWRWLHRHGESF